MNGWDVGEVGARRGGPSTSVCRGKITGVLALIEEARRLTKEAIASTRNSSVGSDFNILREEFIVNELLTL